MRQRQTENRRELMNRTAEWLTVASVLLVLGQMSPMAQAPQAPKPGPAHQRLSYFVGKWNNEGEMKPGPMGPGGKISSTDTCEWFEGRFAVVCHSDGKTTMGPMKSIGFISYSPEEKVYTYYAIDNTGMTMTSVPRGTVQGDTWTFTDEGMMGGQKIKSRVTLKEVSPTSYTFKMELQGADGKWMPAMESTLTKVK
jgi:uncharacterized protein DUF1579